MPSSTETTRKVAAIEAAILIGLGLLFIVVFNAGSENGIGYFHQPEQDLLWPLLNGGLFNGVTFYLHAFWLVPRHLMSRRVGRYLSGLGLLLIGVVFGKTLGEQIIIATGMPELAQLSSGALALENLWMFTAFIFISGIYGVTRYSLARSAHVARLEKDRATAQLAFLRSQIHPHFLFNALNNPYSLSLQQRGEEVTEGISELSELLRFMLYDCQSPFVPLAVEIEFLERLFRLNRSMLSAEESSAVTFEVMGSSDGLSIAPMLLSPLIENAFKHGVSMEEPFFVTTHLEIDGRHLLFEQINSVRSPLAKQEDDHAPQGVGLTNLRQRLELLYPGRHHLLLGLRSGDKEFHASLRLELQ